ncbi:MAG: 2OG-Fe(II) oxygenase [Scytonematopsis contorta HA4267-MV1]|jgi:hypothetical protein|nr:2OG-Fe(II) oxygenase [Scytonematopsis contorta HA4267-MV1]
MRSNSHNKDCNTESQNVLVKISGSLVLADLIDLIHGKFLALCIPNYYPEKEAEVITQELLKQKTLERYLRAPDVGVKRSGMTFFETNGNIELLEIYYEQASAYIKKLREVCFPFLSPIDMLRLDLGDIWLAGANIENIHGRRMLAGIGRVFEDASELPPHQDILSQDIQDSGLAPNGSYEQVITQLSSNIYLQVPKVGGELEIWNLKPSSTEQQAIRNPEYKYEGIIDRASLPPATLVIKPEAGDLILFDSGRIHAVCPSEKDLRASMSMFIGYRGEDKPLTFWS